MPQDKFKVVDVPGQGEVEFPADMSDEQIAAVIRQHTAPNAGLASPGTAPDVPMSEAGSGLSNATYGALKGVASTGTGIAEMLKKVPGLGRMLPGISDKSDIEPVGTAQKAGFYGEQAAEFLAPGGIATKVTKANKLRIAIEAAGSGVLNKAQGGDATTGAIAGAASGGLGVGAKALAPVIRNQASSMEKSLGHYLVNRSLYGVIGGLYNRDNPASVAKGVVGGLILGSPAAHRMAARMLVKTAPAIRFGVGSGLQFDRLPPGHYRTRAKAGDNSVQDASDSDAHDNKD